MTAVNEASLAVVKDDATLLKNKGELFRLAKEKVHEMGYQYAKNSSRSKHFGEGSGEGSCGKAESARKRKYISSSVRQDRINEISESVKSTGETIQLLLKQKEQYVNINKFQQAADVNSTILEKRTEKQKLERELKILQQAGEKLKKYKKKKRSKNKEETSSQSERNPRQKKLSWSSSGTSSGGTKDGESSGGDTLILSDNERFHTVVLSDSSPVLIPDDPSAEDVFKEDEFDGASNGSSPPCSQSVGESVVEN